MVKAPWLGRRRWLGGGGGRRSMAAAMVEAERGQIASEVSVEGLAVVKGAVMAARVVKQAVERGQTAR